MIFHAPLIIGELTMVKKIHVGNLAYSVTEEALRNAFSQFGEVTSVTVVKDKISDRSKGFGFIEMSTDEEASKAIEQLNKSEFEGRMMFVSESRSVDKPRVDSGNRRFGGGGNGGGNGGGPRPDRKPRRF